MNTINLMDKLTCIRVVFKYLKFYLGEAWMIMFDVNVYLRIHTSRGFDRNCHSKNHGGYVAGCKIEMPVVLQKRC